MDIHTRAVTVQQVMSHFALACPKDEASKLVSAVNFPMWENMTKMTLAAQGVGMDTYFETGDMLLADGLNPDDIAVMQLKSALEMGIQIVLMNTVSRKILNKYQGANLFGYQLLLAIRRDYGKVSPRQLFDMVQKVADCAMNKPASDEKSVSLLRDVCAQNPTVQEIMGLFYLMMFKSDQACARVLDAPAPDITLSAVENKLRDMVSNVSTSFSTTSNNTNNGNNGKFKKKGNGNGNGNGNNIVCRRCNQRGHNSVVCPAPSPVASSLKVSDSISGVGWTAFSTTHVTSDLTDCYVLDSGSTLHVCKDEAHFTTLKPSTGSITGIANTHLNVCGTGTIEFIDPESSFKFTLNDVCYVPEATQNLISVKKASATGSFMFCETAAYFVHNQDKVKRKVASVVDPYLYVFDFSPHLGMAHATSSTLTPAVLQEIHEDLGHPSPEVMALMGYPNAPKSIDCSACAAGKSTKTFPKSATSPKAKAPLQLIHADLCGPLPIPGLGAEKYFLTIVDDYSRWSSIVPMDVKSSCNHAMIHFIKSAENHFSAEGYKVATVRTDNGGEFCNNYMEKFYYDKGIHHQRTLPYHSSQNGVAERKHRTVQEKARTLLTASGVPEKFWSEAARTAEFLINRYPSVLNKKSSFELWHGHAPNYSFFHPFGVHCDVLVPREKRHSVFDPATVAGIMLGYSPNHKAYRIYVPSLQDIVVSINVKFNNKVYPYLKKPATLETDSNLPFSDTYFGSAAGGAMLPPEHLSSSCTPYDDSTFVPHSSPNLTSPNRSSSFAPIEVPNNDSDWEPSLDSQEMVNIQEMHHNQADSSFSQNGLIEADREFPGTIFEEIEIDQYVSSADDDYVPSSGSSNQSDVSGSNSLSDNHQVAPDFIEVDQYVSSSNNSIASRHSHSSANSRYSTNSRSGTLQLLPNPIENYVSSDDADYVPLSSSSTNSIASGRNSRSSTHSSSRTHSRSSINSRASTHSRSDPNSRSGTDSRSGTPQLHPNQIENYVSSDDADYVPPSSSSTNSVGSRTNSQSGSLARTTASHSEVDEFFEYLDAHEEFEAAPLPMIPFLQDAPQELETDDPLVEPTFELINSNDTSDESILNQLGDASDPTDSDPLVLESRPRYARTISEVTDTEGPLLTKRHQTGSVFHVFHTVQNALKRFSHSSYLPTKYDEALAAPDARFWSTAIQTELSAHRLNKTWTLCTLPPHRRPIGCRWVFTIKDSTSPPTYKARLVAQGFRQIQGLDYGETFSPVVRYESIRILFAMAAQFDLQIHQMDVTTAFLNGDLDEEIYMQVPPGVSAAPNQVCRLQKSLYGLKQSPLCWNMKINSVLLGAGFNRAVSEFGVYSKVSGADITLVALYVDDLLILSNSPAAIRSVKQTLSSHFKMKDLGLVSTFLGMEVSQSPGVVRLHLNKYLKSFLNDFEMSDCNSVTVPIAPGSSMVPSGKPLSESDASRYRTMVGKLLFAANTVRTDLSYAASSLSRFIKTPYTNHLVAAKHVLRYIKGSTNLGLVFKKSDVFNLTGFCDSDWAGDKVDRKSITGYVFKLGTTVVTWKSTKQQTVALSSTEAEYMALGDAVKELLWLKLLLQHVGMKIYKVPVIFEDNEGCKMLTSHPVHHQRTKHIDIRHHFIRDHVKQEDCKIVSISTENMIGDLLTKGLARIKFQKFVKLAGLELI